MIITGKTLIFRKGEIKSNKKPNWLKVSEESELFNCFRLEIICEMNCIIEYSDSEIKFLKNRYAISEIDFSAIGTAIKMNESIR